MEKDRIQRLEDMVAIIAELILDDALARDASWAERYDPLKIFLKELEDERDIGTNQERKDDRS